MAKGEIQLEYCGWSRIVTTSQWVDDGLLRRHGIDYSPRMRATIAAVLFASACGDDPPVDAGSSTTDPTSAGSTETTQAAVDDANVATTEDGDGETAGADTAGADTQPPGGDPCAPGPDPGLEIGHGDGSFSDFASRPASIVYGPQGGIHIVVGLHAWQLDGSEDAVARLRGRLDGVEVGGSFPYAPLECTPGGELQEALGLLLIWDVAPDVLHGRTVTVDAELTDVAGTVVMATAEVAIVDPMQG